MWREPNHLTCCFCITSTVVRWCNFLYGLLLLHLVFSSISFLSWWCVSRLWLLACMCHTELGGKLGYTVFPLFKLWCICSSIRELFVQRHIYCICSRFRHWFSHGMILYNLGIWNASLLSSVDCPERSLLRFLFRQRP